MLESPGMVGSLSVVEYLGSCLEYNDCIEFKPVYKPFGDRYSVNVAGLVLDRLTNVFVYEQDAGIPNYKYVNLQIPQGERKLKRINRLICEAWIENTEDKPFVDHIDRNRFNNYVGNLRWVTRGENQLNSDRVDRSNIGELSYTKRDTCEFKGVSRGNRGRYFVTFNGEYVGSYSDKIFAARVYDTIIRMLYSRENITYLNFPDLECLDEANLFSYIKRNNKNILQDVVIDKIQYVYMYENIKSVAQLAERFKVSINSAYDAVKFCKQKEKREVVIENMRKATKQRSQEKEYRNKRNEIMRMYRRGMSRKDICDKLSYNRMSMLYSRISPSEKELLQVKDKLQKQIYKEFLLKDIHDLDIKLQTYVDLVYKYELTITVIAGIIRRERYIENN